MKQTTKTTPDKYAEKMKRRNAQKPPPKKGKSRRDPERTRSESVNALLAKIDRWQMATAELYAAGNVLRLKRKRLHNELKARRESIRLADIQIGQMAVRLVKVKTEKKKAIAEGKAALNRSVEKYCMAMDALALACKVSVHKPEYYIEKAKAAGK